MLIKEEGLILWKLIANLKDKIDNLRVAHQENAYRIRIIEEEYEEESNQSKLDDSNEDQK